MKKSFVIVAFTIASFNAHAGSPDQCAAFGDKFAEYARDRDAGMSMEAALKEARAKYGKDGEAFVAGVYLNPEMLHMTPNEIRALAVKTCLQR
ncbi:hypothetical protein JJQ59_34970 (plasmid) [Cupriavidus necator]|uniref:Lipoprotein n=1 Tax=Cupriavidus necator TaxID=106590 RepID=A0A367PS61_CUPNE|nr:hypothetical protein [Cupriavidus necator]QQX89729.1 hypothetical protein JJQ59_34970 [Cupriavidus necator]RCJ10453.1 hypothetical protein DDK22_00360 [Cupriavidus necator]